jgi:hypothetical protein
MNNFCIDLYENTEYINDKKENSNSKYLASSILDKK